MEGTTCSASSIRGTRVRERGDWTALPSPSGSPSRSCRSAGQDSSSFERPIGECDSGPRARINGVLIHVVAKRGYARREARPPVACLVGRPLLALASACWAVEPRAGGGRRDRGDDRRLRGRVRAYAHGSQRAVAASSPGRRAAGARHGGRGLWDPRLGSPRRTRPPPHRPRQARLARAPTRKLGDPGPRSAGLDRARCLVQPECLRRRRRPRGPPRPAPRPRPVPQVGGPRLNAFLVAATVLLVGLAPLLVLASRRRPIDGLVALETAGAVATLALLCLSVGLSESIFFTVALIAVVASWIGGFVFVRFLGRWT